MTDSPKVTTFEVFGYQYCSYANKAVSRVEAVAKAYPDTVKAESKITSRAEYKEWLRNNPKVPSYHTTSPACFENKKFVGGCDDICALLDKKYPVESSGGFCALQ